MRRPRVILFDDEPIVLDVLKRFFELRGYDVHAFREPIICPIYGKGTRCEKPVPCGDLMITDYKMPGMNGLQLLQAQALSGCKLLPQNKALMTGYMDEDSIADIRRLGAAYIEKPFEFDELAVWVDECEKRMDLSQRVAIQRRESRTDCVTPIEFELAGSSGPRAGTVVNMGTSGLCLEVSEPLPSSDDLTLLTVLPLASPTALVKWSRQVSSRAYRIGLQCA